MPRRRFSLFAIAWLLAAGVLLAVTVGSRWRGGIVSYARSGPQFEEVFISIQNGSLWFGRRQFSLMGGMGWKVHWTPVFLRPRELLGLDWETSMLSQCVAVPIWPGVVICIGLAWWAQRRHRRRLAATSENRCMQCGYDLRATSERCPECGRGARETDQSGMSITRR